MTKTRSIVCLGATALLFGCSRRREADDDRHRRHGTGHRRQQRRRHDRKRRHEQRQRRHRQSASTPASTSPSATRRSDGVCSSTSTAAEPVPLDLYVLMDVSQSMNEATSRERCQVGRRPDRDEDVLREPVVGRPRRRPQFFPAVQSSLERNLLHRRSGYRGRAARSGPATAARPVSRPPARRPSSSPLCTTTPPARAEADLLAHPGLRGARNYCAAGPTPRRPRARRIARPSPATATLRDICDAAYYATPDVAVGAARGTDGRTGRDAEDVARPATPAGYTPTGPALTGALMFARQRIASSRHTGWRSCW